MYIDKPLKVGDPVLITGKLPDISGVVVSCVITSRFRISDGTYVTLPNTDVFSSEIHNYSVAVARRIQVIIGIGYNEDTDKAIVFHCVNNSTYYMVLLKMVSYVDTKKQIYMPWREKRANLKKL